jgi:hypothetical protein
MNEKLSLALALPAGLCSVRCSLAAFGGRFARAFRPNGRRFLVLRQPAAADDFIALAGFYFVSAMVIGSGCWCVCSDLSSCASS